MNDFQVAVMLQLIAMIVLLLKIICTADCTGISGKTQILYALVFTMKFVDLPFELQYSLLSFVVKVFYLFIIYLTVVSIYVIFKKSYQLEYDTFRFEYLIGISSVLALLASYKKWEPFNILWYIGLFLETTAIFPQIQLTARTRYIGRSLLFYVGLLACYRAFHSVQWSYQFLVSGHLDNYYVAVTSAAQFLIFCSYFVWMVPMFKAQYVNLKTADSQIIIQPDVLTIVQANSTEESKKIEPILVE